MSAQTKSTPLSRSVKMKATLRLKPVEPGNDEADLFFWQGR
jgi:hypothetical protein